jgi:hypothetical protein
MLLSGWMVTHSISVQWPARCSSIELSTTSHTKVVQAFDIGAADVHPRALAHGLQTFEGGNAAGAGIGGSFFQLICC